MLLGARQAIDAKMMISKEQVLSALATDDPLHELHAAARALPQQVEERLLEMDVAGAVTHITEALKLVSGPHSRALLHLANLTLQAEQNLRRRCTLPEDHIAGGSVQPPRRLCRPSASGGHLFAALP